MGKSLRPSRQKRVSLRNPENVHDGGRLGWTSVGLEPQFFLWFGFYRVVVVAFVCLTFVIHLFPQDEKLVHQVTDFSLMNLLVKGQTLLDLSMTMERKQ